MHLLTRVLTVHGKEAVEVPFSISTFRISVKVRASKYDGYSCYCILKIFRLLFSRPLCDAHVNEASLHT
jgi:hypothetical protein